MASNKLLPFTVFPSLLHQQLSPTKFFLLMKTINDTDTLISDFQTLLTHPHPTPTITLPPKTLSLPRQILSARNKYFRTLLSPCWLPTSRTLTKPNATPQQFQDLLEFLITGCITLSSAPSAIPHNIALASLANEILAEELEHVLAIHIRSTLTRHTIVDYLNAVNLPLPPIDDVLTTFLCSNTSLLVTIPHNPKTVKHVCRLLAVGNLPSDAYPRVARYITTSHISLKDLTNDPNVRKFLLSFPTRTFVRNFESSNLFSPTELLQKYRREAMTLAPPPSQTPVSIRLLHESTHPHSRPARLEDTVKHVVVPGGGYAKLVFDKRSSLSGGAELAFYLEDPALGTHPCKFLVGRRFETCFMLPSNQFWFAFACTEVGPEEVGVFEPRWGWKFFVQCCPPEIDYAR